MPAILDRCRQSVTLHPSLRKALLSCGIVGSVWWVALDVIGSLRYPGYSYVDYSISELSAQGAPTRLFMTLVSGVPYAVLMTAFGVGIWATSGANRAQRVTGAVIVAEVLWGFAGGLAFPMAVRGTEGTLRNQIHSIYGIGMPILFLLAMGFGSRIFGSRFRYFTYAVIAVLLIFGALTAMQGGKVPSGGSTPLMGLEERTNAYASMLWLAVLASGLLMVEGVQIPRQAWSRLISRQHLRQLPH